MTSILQNNLVGGFPWPILPAAPVDKDRLPAKMCYDQNKKKPAADQTNVTHDSANPDNKRKREPTKIIPEVKKKNVNKALTLEPPKQQGTLEGWFKKHVRFDEIVLMKVRELRTSKLVLLSGYSLPNSAFYKKCQQNKLNMRKRHKQRELMPKQMKIKQHVCDTLAKVKL